MESRHRQKDRRRHPAAGPRRPETRRRGRRDRGRIGGVGHRKSLGGDRVRWNRPEAVRPDGRPESGRIAGVSANRVTAADTHGMFTCAVETGGRQSRDPAILNAVLPGLTTLHDLRSVVAVGVVCLIGFTVALVLGRRVLPMRGRTRAAVVVAAGALGGLVVWVVGFGAAGPGQAGLLAAMAIAALFPALVAALLAAVNHWNDGRTLDQIREAVEAMPDAMGFYDPGGRLVLWNARYAEVNTELVAKLTTGMRFEEVLQIGLDAGIYTDAIGRQAEWRAERLAAREQLSATLEQHRDDGRWLRVQDRRTSNGGIVTLVTDITDLRRDARALAEARDAAEAANAAKSLFLANMSHEIRTPLNGVIGLAQALGRTDLGPDQREMLELMQSSSRMLLTLLGDILDLARIESGRLSLEDEPFELKTAVREAADLYRASAAAKGLALVVDVCPECPDWVAGDVVRLKQVMCNLVSNAVKFTESGLIKLEAQCGPAVDGTPTLRIAVSDTGIGFGPEQRDRLFGRFEQADGAITRRYGGSGLGLSICRQLAGMMGGALDAESEPGGGSTFLLTVPLRAAEAPAAIDPDVVATPEAGATVRVLLADDHPTNRKVVELILGAAAVQLTSVEDGAEAVAAYCAGTFDLVLMDMQMPVMDGLTATRAIREFECENDRPLTPIVMLTANALPEHVAAARAAGADKHLAKPFEAAELLALVTSPDRAVAQAA
ncbi:MAG: response regulator [Alphaproteobacteria bacterium]|nr:response regulator [Alphaproteobacteria bacterium]MBU1526260.1 response regulator [Alphaproteobacteria bacterium]MBU2116639.1 response regulator [Alphaproteobacteria bacterium]MBU2351417.1 response regulator [Alphaproteobacteria bacterium]MBU2382452.1 response regulator [Alphaproteobacteria bacterium]